MRHKTPPDPSGCRWCGIEERSHGNRFVRGHGLHRWEPPTLAQLRARIEWRAKQRMRETELLYRGLDDELRLMVRTGRLLGFKRMEAANER